MEIRPRVIEVQRPTHYEMIFTVDETDRLKRELENCSWLDDWSANPALRALYERIKNRNNIYT